MDTDAKAKAGPELVALILESGGRVPYGRMGDLAVDAGYEHRSDWGGYLNGENGLRKDGNDVVLTDLAWKDVADCYRKVRISQ
jgi:hypothetical protein